MTKTETKKPEFYKVLSIADKFFEVERETKINLYETITKENQELLWFASNFSGDEYGSYIADYISELKRAFHQKCFNSTFCKGELTKQEQAELAALQGEIKELYSNKTALEFEIQSWGGEDVPENTGDNLRPNSRIIEERRKWGLNYLNDLPLMSARFTALYKLRAQLRENKANIVAWLKALANSEGAKFIANFKKNIENFKQEALAA